MKKSLLFLLVLSAILYSASADAFTNIWRPVAEANMPVTGTRVIAPGKMLTFELNDAYMKGYLFSLNDNPNANQQLELPTPDGGLRTFVIWKNDLMAPALEVRYPGIRSFTAYALDDPRVVAKVDYTLKGFHAMIFDGANTYFIDPYTNVNDGNYMCYYKHDFVKPLHQRMVCQNGDDENISITEDEQMSIGGNEELPGMNYKVLNGYQKRQYRLALACTYEYSMAVDGPVPTKPGVLSAMVTSVNRVTGVYELEMAISLQLIGNTDTLIFLTSSDPYTNNNGSTMLGQNQTTVTNRIGSGNYDIGHVFSTGGGGIASLGSICGNNKAQGVTGSANPVGDAFDIDYVAHEMGHQFGGPHTFNNNSSGSCSGNRSGNNAYEPGSGSTIMAYAGICGSGEDLQQHSDAYFHSNSIQRMYNTITQSSKNNCPVKTTTGNAPSGLADYNATYYIPFLTPFELQAPLATDSMAVDTLTTYCWEEFDLGAASTWANASTTGPIFRSFNPTTSRWRVFPQLPRLVNNITNYVGEKLPPDARTLKFVVTARSVYQGLGCINFTDDTIKLNVINTTTPFAVTSPNTNVLWPAASTQTVTWDVSSTTAAPISCANVDIFLSVDGGYTYPHTVATNVPNTGSAIITVPNVPPTSTARIKVKGAGNVFFDISNTNFRIPWHVGVENTATAANSVKIFPVPASDVLNLSGDTGNPLQVSIFSAIGQSVYTGTLQSELQLDVKEWAKGIYYIHFVSENGERFSKPVVIQ